MDLATAAEVVQAAAVFVALTYGVLEFKRYRSRQAREAAATLVQSYETPEFAMAIYLLPGLPVFESRAEMEAALGEDTRFVALLMTTWESLGILVFRRQVEFQLVDDFFSGAVVMSWRKLARVVEDMRAAEGRDTYFEWFQWLAERFDRVERDRPPVPAHVEHGDWLPHEADTARPRGPAPPAPPDA